MRSDRHITLKCGTVLYLDDLETARLSYVPCGQVNGEDQPLFSYAHLWGNKQQVKIVTFGKKANAWTLSRMTGIQLMTGTPTFRTHTPHDYHLVDIDIEKHLIATDPETIKKILTIYRTRCDGTPCIVETKSGGLRLSAFAPYLDRKRSFEDSDGMLLEIFSEKGLSRLDHRYAMREGSLLDIPSLEKSVLQDIHGIISEIAPEKAHRKTTDRKTVSTSQIGDLNIQWGKDGRSQFFSASHCRVTEHQTTRETVRFTKYPDGSIDGKCFNCGETWWEVPPKPTNRAPKPPAPSPVDIHTRSFKHWTPEERLVVREILRLSPDAGWHHGTPAFATRYANLYPITGEFKLNGQPSEVEKRRVWSTQFSTCPDCGGITASWVDRYLLTAGTYCNNCHTDTPIGSYLDYELTRKLPNSIVSEHQGYLGDDPEFQDFRLWEPEMLTHLGAGMSTGKSTEIYKAIVALAGQNLGVGIIAAPRISLSRFLAHHLRKRHGKRAWGLWHEGSSSAEQFIGNYGAIVCLPSLARAVSAAYAQGLDASSLYLAIDEVDFGYNLLALAVHQAAAVKKCLLDIFNNTGLVVSGQTESTLSLEAVAAELGCENLQGFYNTAPPAEGTVEMRKYPAVAGKNAIVLAGAIDAINDAINADYNVYVFCSARRDSEIIAERFAEYRPVCYNAYTKGDPRCDAVLQNQRLTNGDRLFIGTSAAGVGISILDPKAKTIIVAGLNHGSRGTAMLVQKAVRDRGRRGVQIHYTDYTTALPIHPQETERVSLYHEEIKHHENRYAHLPKNAVKKVARSLALSTIADTQLETFVNHHLQEVGNMPVAYTHAILPEDAAVESVVEHRRQSIATERQTKQTRAIAALTDRNLYTTRDIRVAANNGHLTTPQQIAHEYANGLARAVGWDDAHGPLTDTAIAIACELAAENRDPDRVAKIRRGYLAVHYPEWVSAVFSKEIVDAETDLLAAGEGRELTAITDDRFLGKVLTALLNRLTGEIFNTDAEFAAAIREVLDTVSHGQTIFGRIKHGGLGANAYRRARFLNTAGDAYVINWAKTFIKEFYPATVSKRGNAHSLVHDKRIELLLASIDCWLEHHTEAHELPNTSKVFHPIEPHAEIRAKVRAKRKAGERIETIAAEFNISTGAVSKWCKDIEVVKKTVRGTQTEKRGQKAELKKRAQEMKAAGMSRAEIARQIKDVSQRTLYRWLE